MPSGSIPFSLSARSKLCCQTAVGHVCQTFVPKISSKMRRHSLTLNAQICRWEAQGIRGTRLSPSKMPHWTNWTPVYRIWPCKRVTKGTHLTPRHGNLCQRSSTCCMYLQLSSKLILICLFSATHRVQTWESVMYGSRISTGDYLQLSACPLWHRRSVYGESVAALRSPVTSGEQSSDPRVAYMHAILSSGVPAVLS